MLSEFDTSLRLQITKVFLWRQLQIIFYSRLFPFLQTQTTFLLQGERLKLEYNGFTLPSFHFISFGIYLKAFRGQKAKLHAILQLIILYTI